MSVAFKFPCIHSFYFTFFLLVVSTLFRLCLSTENNDSVLCLGDERQALLQFKHGLIDEAYRLASWAGEESDCCKWAGILCDNITGHVHNIHQPGDCSIDNSILGGEISPSILLLKQLKHLDLSCNDFSGIQIPKFIGYLGNLRYLNLSSSGFSGKIPPQVGNLTELRILCLGNYKEGYEFTSVVNMEWLSSLQFLSHLDMSGVDLTDATSWLQVISTLPSLVELHLSNTKLSNIQPHVASLNLTSLSLLDLSWNDFKNSFMPRWIFSISSLVTLDLGRCHLKGPISSGIYSFHNLTSLMFLDMARNEFMSSSLVLKGLSSIGGNMISLDISSCGVSSLALDSLHNLTSLLSLDLSFNQLTNNLPKSIGNFCNLKHFSMGYNNFPNISLTSLLEIILGCKSPSLVHLQLSKNSIVGPIPESIGRLLSLEFLDLSSNHLTGTLPESLGQLSKLNILHLSNNSLTGVVTEAHFSKLSELKHLDGIGNNLTLRPHVANWIPSFQLKSLSLSSWNLGPHFPLWLLSQKDLIDLELRNTRISSTMPESFSRSFPNIRYLDMSQNQIQGRLFDIPASLEVVDLSSNLFSGKLPKVFSNSISIVMDLSNNSFTGSLHHLLCPYGGKRLYELNLANNHLTGAIPECWVKWPGLSFLNLENNNLSGEIPTSLGSLSFLQSLNMCKNKLSGRLPASLKKLTKLVILQFATNELTGSIPTWIGTKLSRLGILNLRSNNFEGNVTYELCYLTSIQILDLADNNLSGKIPRCFNNFSVLSRKETPNGGQFEYLGIGNKAVMGSASLVTKGQEYTYSSILDLVMVLDLSSNNFSGNIPIELMALQALQSLNLSKNQFTGRIPEHIGDLKLLESFDVSLNRLSGALPSGLSRLSFLSSFNVSFNNLTGRIPSSTQLQSFNESSFVGNKLCGLPLTKLCGGVVHQRDQQEGDKSHGVDFGLIISILLANNFEGNVTYELCYLTSIQILDLADNNLSGKIPRCFNNFSVLSRKETPNGGQFEYLGIGNKAVMGSASLVTKGQEYTYSSILDLVMVLDLSGNNFSGNIPIELMALQALQSLNLSKNQFTGRIPEHIGDLKLLESFDVSLNRLSGALPSGLSRLSFLSSFNVSFNNLTGRIPSSTQLQSFNESSFVGNKLCGLPLTKLCGGVVHQRDQQEGDKSHGVDFGLIISILLGFFIGFGGIVVAMCVGAVQSLIRK